MNKTKKIVRIIPAKLRSILKGMSSYIPPLYRLISKGTGGTVNARYCYSVWLRHLVMAGQSGLSTCPNTIVELGPGDSLGIGLAGLITGANIYFAFDVVEYAGNNKNIEILDELIKLFTKQEDIPNETEFTEVEPRLNSYKFPSEILTDTRLDEVLKPERLDEIKNALINLDKNQNKDILISYVVPWYDAKLLKENSIDMIISQAVMEHVDDLYLTYEMLYHWLKPGGVLSCEIDFRSHGTAKEWNGHWEYSDSVWSLLKGRRPYFINRQPHSTHIQLLESVGFKIICDLKTKDFTGIQRSSLAPRFNDISDDDLTTKTAFIQAIK